MAEYDKRAFINRRVHSLLGLIPVGLFLLEHLFMNAHAMHGSEVYNGRVEFLVSLPFVWALELFFIFLPLALHAFYGLWIVLTGRWNTHAWGTERNWNYVLQRVSGVVVLAYVAWHVWETKVWSLQAAAGGHPDFFVRMQDLLAVPWVLALYVVGVGAAVYHFANGMWNFGITWGVTLTRVSQKRAIWFWALVGLALFVLGVSSLLSFNGLWPNSPGI